MKAGIEKQDEGNYRLCLSSDSLKEQLQVFIFDKRLRSDGDTHNQVKRDFT